jgi:hypothetical protein
MWVDFSGLLINKTDRHDIAEILLKVALNTIIRNQAEDTGKKRQNVEKESKYKKVFNF